MIKLPRAISKEAIQIQAELTTQEAWRYHKHSFMHVASVLPLRRCGKVTNLSWALAK